MGNNKNFQSESPVPASGEGNGGKSISRHTEAAAELGENFGKDSFLL